MSRPISAIRKSWLVGDDRGEAMIGFAFLIPVLMLISLGILEFTLAVFDYHRAGEATRRGARMAAISPPIADVGGFVSGSVIECASSGGGVICTGAAVADPSVFDAVVGEMRAILPAIQAGNVRITYSDSGLGDAATPGGILPLVTVRLDGLVHRYLMLRGFPGFPDGITFPTFATNQLSSGFGAAAS
ncbi:MAG: TadE/TadG family type IV pilus assembly protein [Rhodospirillales bacterium]